VRAFPAQPSCNARIGSAHAARRAGNHAASTEVPSSTAAAAAYVVGSSALGSNSRPRSNCVMSDAATAPTARPTKVMEKV